MDFMKFDQSFKNYLGTIDDLKNKIEEISKLSQKKEQIELINDILDARDARKENIVYKTVVDNGTYQLIKNQATREIAEECSKGIWAEIESLTDSLMPKLNSYDTISFMNHCKKNIMKIIRGE